MKINKLMVTLGMMTALCTQGATSIQAQELKKFTLEDLNYGGNNYHNMIAENRWTTWWGDELVRTDAENCKLINKNTGKETMLFTLDDIKAKSGLNIHSLFNVSFPEGKKPLVLLSDSKHTQLLNWKTGKTVWTIANEDRMAAQAWDFNYASRNTAYVKDDQLYVQTADGQSKQLTTDGNRNIVYGQSVHRDEFGITGGLFWSNQGTKLAFYRMDQSMVTDFPLVDIPDPSWVPTSGSRIAQPAPEKYPMAGETSHKVTVGVYDVKAGKTVWLKAGDPTDRYFTNVAWSPDDKTLYIFELNRDQNDCQLVAYDAETGDRKGVIYHETDAKYVEPQHPIVFLPWDHSQFIMQSQKDGFNHLYLFNTKGEQLKQITSGNWVVMEFLGFNEKRHSAIIASNERNAIQRNIYSVNIDNGKRTLVDDNGEGWHTASLSPSGQYVVDKYSTPSVPRNIAIANVENGKKTRYLTAVDPWKGYGVPEYKSGTVKAADGKTDLYYRMVMPVGFDANKKYPTIIYVYGGPHAHNVDASWHWGSRSWETYMAQKGYLLFILDNRGSEHRGKEFEQATFRHLGDNEVKDQMEGVKYLKSLPYVDADRIGVHGWSFGGFMTINMMTTHPEVFKVGVAGGPVIDWKWYEVMYGERYMDTPQTNPDGYAASSLIPKAKNLKGKLQIIIGLNDPVCLPQHTLSFIKQCIQDGTQPDFFVYPGEPHNMRGHQSTHLHERISQYFDDYLK
jgi:dipeptidyl-peptidase 4